MIRLMFWVVVVVLACAQAALGSFHDRFVVFFPQAVKGLLGQNYYETVIVISNPGPDVAEITLKSCCTNKPPLPKSVLQVKSGETHSISITGQDFQMGWVRLESNRPVASAAHILSRSSLTSQAIISQVTILGQPATSKVVIPVFRFPNVLAENTGIAIASPQSGRLQFTLRDPQGTAVASTSLNANTSFAADFFGHLARFVTELFPSLPTDFTEGSLTVEFFGPGNTSIPLAFAATALYTRGANLWAASVEAIDTPGRYKVKFKTADQQQIQQMAAQYGFSIKEIDGNDPALYLVIMVEEVARAVGRDPRVERVTPDSVLPLTL